MRRQITIRIFRTLIASCGVQVIVPASCLLTSFNVSDELRFKEFSMFVSTAYAQSGSGGGGLEALLPLVLIFVVFYFLLIRPQQKKMKQHREMLAAVRRKDTVVTGGGIVGKVVKVDNDVELTVEIAKGVEVKVRREMVSAVMSKTAAVSGSAANEEKPRGGFLGSLFGGGAVQKAEGVSSADDKNTDSQSDNVSSDEKKKKTD